LSSLSPTRKGFQDVFALHCGISELDLKTASVFWLHHLQPHASQSFLMIKHSQENNMVFESGKSMDLKITV